jgi:hypothetical protein
MNVPVPTTEAQRSKAATQRDTLSVRGPMSDELQLVVSIQTGTLQLHLSPTYCHRIARQAEARRTLARSFAGSETCPEKQDLTNLLYRHGGCTEKPYFERSRSTKTLRKIFPEGDLGILSTNSR